MFIAFKKREDAFSSTVYDMLILQPIYDITMTAPKGLI